MAHEAENAIYQKLASAPLFHPASADLFASDWSLEPGDVVTVKDGETNYNVPIYSMNLDWRGDSRVGVQSTGNETREPLPALKRKQYGASSAAYNGIREQANRISLVVTGKGADAQIKTAAIVAAINESGSEIQLSADKIYMNGQTLVDTISGMNANFTNLITGNTTATTLRANAMYSHTINLGENGLWVHNGTGYVNATWQSDYVYTYLPIGSPVNIVTTNKQTITSFEDLTIITGRIITGNATRHTIDYLGW